jgi:hypothetical protein
MKKRSTGSSGQLPTTGRIGRIVKKLIAKTGLVTAKKTMKGVDEFETLSPAEKADYIKDMIARMKKLAGNAQTKDILVSCGMMCCGVTSRRRVAQLKSESTSIKDLLEKMNKRHLGGGRLKLKDAHTITGGYDQCYCGMVSRTRTPFPDLTYCQCSTGWYRQLFETALGRPVKVRILKSILCGAKTCEFVITF